MRMWLCAALLLLLCGSIGWTSGAPLREVRCGGVVPVHPSLSTADYLANPPAIFPVSTFRYASSFVLPSSASATTPAGSSLLHAVSLDFGDSVEPDVLHVPTRGVDPLVAPVATQVLGTVDFDATGDTRAVVYETGLPGTAFPHEAWVLFLRSAYPTTIQTGRPRPLARVFNVTDVASTGTSLMYFAGSNSTEEGTELWVLEVGAAGLDARQLSLCPGAASSSPSDLTFVQSLLLFTADDCSGVRRLYMTDGTTVDTVPAVDDWNVTHPTGLTRIGSDVYLSGCLNETDCELYTVSFASGSPLLSLAADLAPDGAGSDPAHLTSVSGTSFMSGAGVLVYTAVADAAVGRELYVFDGMTATLVADIESGAGDAFSTANDPGFVVVESALYFAATTSSNGTEPWMSDGSAANTQLVADIVSGSGSSNPSEFVGHSSFVFFAADTSASGRELLVSNGTAAGTMIAREFVSGPGVGGSPTGLLSLGHYLVFVASQIEASTDPREYYMYSCTVVPEFYVDEFIGPSLVDGESAVYQIFGSNYSSYIHDDTLFEVSVGLTATGLSTVATNAATTDSALVVTVTGSMSSSGQSVVSAASLPLVNTPTLSGIPCRECARFCSFPDTLVSVPGNASTMLQTVVAGPGFGDPLEYHFVVTPRPASEWVLPLPGSTTDSVNCSLSKIYAFDVPDETCTIVISVATTSALPQNGVLFLRYEALPTPSEWDVRQPFRSLGRVSFSLPGTRQGSTEITDAAPGRYYIAVAADIASFEYDDLPVPQRTSRSFDCCSTPLSYKLSIDVQAEGLAYTGPLMLPAIMVVPILFLLIVGGVVLRIGRPNVVDYLNYTHLRMLHKHTVSFDSNAQDPSKFWSHLMEWPHRSSALAHDKSARLELRQPNLDPNLDAVVQAASAADATTGPGTGAGGAGGAGAGDKAGPVDGTVYSHHHAGEAAIGCRRDVWKAPGVVGLAVCLPAMLWQWVSAFRGHQLGEPSQCLYNHRCKRDIELDGFGIPAINAVWPGTVYALVGVFLVLYSLMMERFRIPAWLTRAHRRTGPYFGVRALGVTTFFIGLAVGSEELCPNRYVPHLSMVFLGGSMLLGAVLAIQKLSRALGATAVLMVTGLRCHLVAVLLVFAGLYVPGAATDMWGSTVLPVTAICLVVGGTLAQTVTAMSSSPTLTMKHVPMLHALWTGLKQHRLLTAFLTVVAVATSIAASVLNWQAEQWVLVACFATLVAPTLALVVRKFVMLAHQGCRVRKPQPPAHADPLSPAILMSRMHRFEFPTVVTLVSFLGFAAAASVATLLWASQESRDVGARIPDASNPDNDACMFMDFYDARGVGHMLAALALGLFGVFILHVDDDVTLPPEAELLVGRELSRDRSAPASRQAMPQPHAVFAPHRHPISPVVAL